MTYKELVNTRACQTARPQPGDTSAGSSHMATNKGEWPHRGRVVNNDGGGQVAAQRGQVLDGKGASAAAQRAHREAGVAVQPVRKEAPLRVELVQDGGRVALCGARHSGWCSGAWGGAPQSRWGA